MNKTFFASLITLPLAPFAQANAGMTDLDLAYGVANRPSYIKHYEVDKYGEVMLNPYLQVGSKEYPAILDPSRPVYNYVVTQEGNVALIEEAPHPYGRTYKKGFFRPEDQSQRKPGSQEKYGHPSAVAGGAARIGGEIINNEKAGCWLVNNKSGRYSKRNHDRTPEQFLNAYRLIQEVVDPNGQPFCSEGIYLLAYAPDYVGKALRQSPDLVYEDPKKKKNAHILVKNGKVPHFEIPIYRHTSTVQGIEAPVKLEKKLEKEPEKTSIKGKTTYNDDPS